MTFGQKNGFTLVELLVSAYILLIGICGILSLFGNLMISTESAWETTVATSHAQYILEEMQNKKTLADIELIDWKKWVQDQNLTTLPQEELNVIFPAPASDPLEIQVIDQWQKNSRVSTINLRTQLTK